LIDTGSPMPSPSWSLPITGQLLIHFKGCKWTTLPYTPLSWKWKNQSSPVCVCTHAPWCGPFIFDFPWCKTCGSQHSWFLVVLGTKLKVRPKLHVSIIWERFWRNRRP
jgi:hypothetical protein